MVKAVGKPKAELVKPVELAEDETPEAHKEMIKLATEWIKENVPKILFDKALIGKDQQKESGLRRPRSADGVFGSKNVGKDRRKLALPLYDEYVENEVTRAILEEDKRVDGRKLTQIRPLEAIVAMLPRTHGSALFNRGETQVLSVVTLGSPGDAQMMEGLEESSQKRFMHHYNFPPYSVG